VSFSAHINVLFYFLDKIGERWIYHVLKNHNQLLRNKVVFYELMYVEVTFIEERKIHGTCDNADLISKNYKCCEGCKLWGMMLCN
jgi:hypothetical protein